MTSSAAWAIGMAIVASCAALGCGGSDEGGGAVEPTSDSQGEALRDGVDSSVEDVVEIEVYLDGAWETVCTGTALRNNVVLTAQHCLGLPFAQFGQIIRLFAVPGQSNPNAPRDWDWRVRTVGGAHAQVSSVVRLVQANYSPQFQENDYWLTNRPDPTTLRSDAALLFLDRKLTFFGESTNHAREISRYTSAQMNQALHLCVGFGNNAGTASGGTGAGTQRWGYVQVFQPTLHEGDSRWVQYWPNYSTPNGIIQMQGDSGGPCFHLHDGYWWQVASVHSYQRTQCSGCTATHYAAEQTGAEVFRTSARIQMDLRVGSALWSFGSLPSDGKAVAPSPLNGGTPNWHVSNGELRENSNAFGSSSTFEGPLFLRDGIYGNVHLSVTVRSSDDDSAGLVLRYGNPDHYYRASFDEERRFLRITKRSGGETTVLGTRTISIDHSTTHTLEFWAWEGQLNARLTGSDVNVTLEATDNSEDALMDGRGGIYKYGLENARFDNFRVTPLAGPL